MPVNTTGAGASLEEIASDELGAADELGAGVTDEAPGKLLAGTLETTLAAGAVDASLELVWPCGLLQATNATKMLDTNEPATNNFLNLFAMLFLLFLMDILI